MTGIPESPIEFLLWLSTRCDINGQKKFFKVDEPVVIRVERPKHVVAELVGVAHRETFAVDVHESFGSKTTIRTVAHEATVPLLE